MTYNFLVFLVIILSLISAFLLLLIFCFTKFKVIKEYFFKIIYHIIDNLYLYLIPFPIVYLLTYYMYLSKIEGQENLSFFFKPEIIEYLKQISIIFFTGGVFTATVKLINNMVIFKKNFHKMILSDDFDKLLTDKFKILSLSNEYLSNRKDINDVWLRVTSCRFAKSFPNLNEKINNKLQNDFFDDKMLQYYYDNFRIQINIELVKDNIIKITEVSNFKLVSNSLENIDLEFKISSLYQDDGDIYTNLIKESCTVNELAMNFTETSLIENKAKIFSTKLSGHNNYVIERKVEMTQNLENDRVFTFSSSIIIDNILIDIKVCDELDYFFAPSGKNKYPLDSHNNDNTTYLSRELQMPGERFKVFIFKK